MDLLSSIVFPQKLLSYSIANRQSLVNEGT